MAGIGVFQASGDPNGGRPALTHGRCPTRAAVGAGQRDIRNLVFAEGFRLIAGGVISGIAAALVLSRVLRSFLFEVETTDPATLIGVGSLFVSVALLACWAPTRRAAKVDPLEALRYE